MPVPPVPAPLVFSVRDQHLFQVRGELRREKPACRNAGEPGTQRFLMCQGRFVPPVFLRAPEISGHFHPLLCGEGEHKSRPSASDDPNGNETSQRICLMGSSPTCPPACGGDRQGTSSAVCGAVVCGARCELAEPCALVETARILLPRPNSRVFAGGSVFVFSCVYTGLKAKAVFSPASSQPA